MDLNSMFQNLGPAGGAMLTGMQMRDTQNEQESQQAMRQAQMDEIMQRTAQQKLMNPLELQAKQQGLDTGKLALETGGLANKKAQLELDAAPLEIQVKNLQRSSQLLGAASTYLSTVPPVQRHAALKQYAVENGINMNSPTIQGLWNQLSSVKGEEIPKVLNNFRENVMRQESTVYSHLKGLEISGETSKEVARIGATSRENIANAKKKATDIVSQVQGGKLSYEKAAVAFSVMAEMEADPVDKAKYLQMAQTYEQLNLNAKNAASQGKIDPGAMTGLPTIQTPTVLGGGGPKKGTAENPIKLD
jgi:hypothetical protein